jgi:hypothetical protein
VWHRIFAFWENRFMNNTDPVRNQPADEGKRDDPALRDESAIQPGVNTISSSSTDTENKELTKTAADDFRTNDEEDKNADPRFDEVDKR